jgi:hypothetical protein
MRYPLTTLLLLCLAGPAVADDGVDRTLELGDASQFDIADQKIDANPHTSGWQISQTWYFGRDEDKKSSVGFVWQREDDQMSITTKGIRFSRRF